LKHEKCNDVKSTKEVIKRLELVDEICAMLGLSRGEVIRVAGVMLEVWGEENKASV
jgi:hypothetical protein